MAGSLRRCKHDPGVEVEFEVASTQEKSKAQGYPGSLRLVGSWYYCMGVLVTVAVLLSSLHGTPATAATGSV